MLPTDTRERLRLESQTRYDDLLEELLAEAGIVQVWSGNAVLASFTDWFDQELLGRNWSDPGARAALCQAAVDQLTWSAALRWINKDAWDAAEATLQAPLDGNVVGSAGRGEACRYSDFDILLVARDDAELRQAGLPIGPVGEAVEDERTQELRASKWWGATFLPFVRTTFGYAPDLRRNGIAKGADLYGVAASEFQDLRQLPWNDGYSRHGGNLLSSYALRRTLDRSDAALLAVRRRNDRAALARHRLAAATWARRRIASETRPHDAHALLSQLWQAMLFYLYGALAPNPPKWPYWTVPLHLDMSPDSRASWRIGIEAIASGRRDNPRSSVPARLATPAALAMIHSAPGALRPNAVREMKRAILNPEF